MLILGNICATKEEARTKLEENIKNGKGIEKLKELIISQNGNPEIINNYSLLSLSSCKKEIISEQSGYISYMDTYNIGKAASETGAGRKTKDDKIDYGAGIILKHSLGDKIEKGDVIAEIYAKTKEKTENAAKILNSSIKISSEPFKTRKSILKVIGA